MRDPIERQAAIDALCDNCDNVQAVCAHYPCKQYIALEKIEGSPYAQPEPLTVNFAREMDRETIERLKDEMKNAPILIMAVNDSSQPEQMWIRCSERLPEYGEDVLITDECGVYIARCYNLSRNREEPQASWWYGDANEYRTHPLAWMPLPEPYKEGQE